MKISEMVRDVTYIICPDKTCKLFWDRSRSIACDGSCPLKEKEKFIIICHECDEMIELPGTHGRPFRITHDCPNGMRAENFRMGHAYHLLYEIPTKD